MKGNDRNSGYDSNGVWLPVDVELTAEEIRHKYHYDGALGKLRHRIPSPRIYVGRPAGAISRCGYRQIRYKGRLYTETRLIWLWVYGTHPVGELDHINGVRDDNRIENLRQASRSQNVRNRAPTGPYKKGVSKRLDKWRAQIGYDGKKVMLGTFDTEDEAHAAYCRAASEAYGEFARLS